VAGCGGVHLPGAAPWPAGARAAGRIRVPVAPHPGGLTAKSALVLGDYGGNDTNVISGTGALFAMQHTRWDHGLKVTADGAGLAGHAGAVLLRLLADRSGLTAGLGPALARPGKSPQADRGMTLVSMAAAIALGATSMSDVEVLSPLGPALGAAPPDTTVRRTLELACPRTLRRIAKARARARAHVWKLIAERPGGFPWPEIAGKTLKGWLVIDMDAALVTASSDKEGAAPTWKKGYGFHPLGAWLASTRECLAMLLRPGNAGSNTVTDHIEVLAAAIAQVPARFRSRLLVRADGAGASHELIEHLLELASPRRRVLFTCGWMITGAGEDAIKMLPASAWKPGIDQDGNPEDDKHVAEVTHHLAIAVTGQRDEHRRPERLAVRRRIGLPDRPGRDRPAGQVGGVLATPGRAVTAFGACRQDIAADARPGNLLVQLGGQFVQFARVLPGRFRLVAVLLRLGPVLDPHELHVVRVIRNDDRFGLQVPALAALRRPERR
jgi:hypothetical protein